MTARPESFRGVLSDLSVSARQEYAHVGSNGRGTNEGDAPADAGRRSTLAVAPSTPGRTRPRSERPWVRPGSSATIG